jgi:tetratricopeptide (TPR) repeat protein
MNIKFSQKKQEMRDDPVLDFFLNAKQYVAKNANTMIGVIIVVAFVGIVALVYLQIKRSGSEKAEEAFGNAMIEYNNRAIEKAVEDFRIVADNHRTTSPGVMSALMLGGIFSNMGRYDEAIQWFEAAGSKKSGPGFVGAEALEGCANCYEAKGDIPKALEYLGKALRDDRNRYRHAAIRWKMALLNEKIKDVVHAKTFCREILSDTTATDYRKPAENLLAVLEAMSG